MRKVTNKSFLPQPLVHAVSHDRYDPGDGDISATSLIGPAQQRKLEQEHKDEIETDALDLIWSLIGSAVHYILENAVIDMQKTGVWDESRHLAEQRFYAEVGGKKVSAQIDLKEDDALYDFKVTSAWTVKHAIHDKEGKPEWDAQLNIQRYLMQKNGYEINKLFIMAIVRDWNFGDSMRDSKYPPRGCLIEIPVWSMEKTEGYIQERLNAHFAPITPLCTPDECWEKPTTYALMKEGRKTAVRVMPTKADILDFAVSNGHAEVTGPGKIEDVAELKTGITIDTRQGARLRCERYCDVSRFCDQYEKWKKDTS